jgi:hypothetical protein
MTLFRSSGRLIGDAVPTEDGIFQVKLVLKDPQTRRLPNLDVVTKHLARTERPF